VALSQYFCDASFPEVTANVGAIEAAARRFVAEDLAPVLPASHRSCVLDLVVRVPTASASLGPGAPAANSAGTSAAATTASPLVRVVELNPWSERTGPCLFHWGRDQALLRGKRPFEFRVVSAAESPARHHLLPWAHLLAKTQAEPSSPLGAAAAAPSPSPSKGMRESCAVG
jgi:hypothetical protein